MCFWTICLILGGSADAIAMNKIRMELRRFKELGFGFISVVRM
ncbi:MAG: hypothetical protein ACXQTS_05135 [Candidatus Methanospirareceae archaeon]